MVFHVEKMKRYVLDGDGNTHEQKVQFLTMSLDPPPSTKFERQNCSSWIKQRARTRVNSWTSSASLVICTARFERSLNSLVKPVPPTVSLCSCKGFVVQYVYSFCFQCRRNTTMLSARTMKTAMQAGTIISKVAVGVLVGVGLYCSSRRLSREYCRYISRFQYCLWTHWTYQHQIPYCWSTSLHIVSGEIPGH
jgi:hypothetical protein